jgi:hypothetical protein
VGDGLCQANTFEEKRKQARWEGRMTEARNEQKMKSPVWNVVCRPVLLEEVVKSVRWSVMTLVTYFLTRSM